MRRSELRAHCGGGGSTLPLATRQLDCSPGRCLTGRHKAGVPGSIPGTATRGWASDQRSFMCSARRVRHPDPPLQHGRVRKQVKRSRRGRGDFVGSIPTLVTATIPWSSGKDAWMTPRKSAVRFCPGSLKRRSVGVVVARVLGKDEARVQFPDGPLEIMGGWSNGKTPGLQPGDRGSIPRPVHYEPTSKDRRKAPPKGSLHDVYVLSLDGKRERPVQGQG